MSTGGAGEGRAVAARGVAAEVHGDVEATQGCAAQRGQVAEQRVPQKVWRHYPGLPWRVWGAAKKGLSHRVGAVPHAISLVKELATQASDRNAKASWYCLSAIGDDPGASAIALHRPDGAPEGASTRGGEGHSRQICKAAQSRARTGRQGCASASLHAGSAAWGRSLARVATGAAELASSRIGIRIARSAAAATARRKGIVFPSRARIGDNAGSWGGGARG